jgi:serine/threonine-protein kinase
MRPSVWHVLATVVLSGCGSAGDAAEARRLYEEGSVFEDRRIGADDWRAAEDLYRQAVAADSTFALAHAALARVHAAMVHFMYDPTAERRAMSRASAATALRLEPDLPEAHYAMGAYHYWGNKQYDSASAELRIALEDLANDARVLAVAGFVERRRGAWEEGLAYMERAARLDPLAVTVDLPNSYAALGRMDEAMAAFEEFIRAQPEGHHEMDRALALLRREGNLDDLRTTLASLPAGFDPDGNVTRARLELAWAERRPDAALAAIADYSGGVLQDQNTYFPLALLSARAHRLARRDAQANVALDSARTVLQAAVRERPEEARVHAALARTLAMLGDVAGAESAAERALALMPRERDALNSQAIKRQAAGVYAEIGRNDRAMELLEDVFSRPDLEYGRASLRLDPTWDRIRDLPAFQRLATG